MNDEVEFRELGRAQLPRVGEIDRRERIELLYEQHGTELVVRPGEWNAAAWDPAGHGEHSVAAQVRALERCLDAGGTVLGAFIGERLVGIGAVVPHLRDGIAQLTYLYVDASRRGSGLGGDLAARLEEIARAAGDVEMVVSATPSENTVRFYMGRGFEPMEEPLAELFAVEPDDIHMHKSL